VLVFAFGTADSGIPREWAAGAATPGVHLIDDLSPKTVARIASLVGTRKRPSDLAVASIHWGRNWSYDIPAAQRRFAHALIDTAGIDVVHGHSSHHPKAIEVYRDRPILYGCGDFLNDYEGIPGHKDFRADLVLMYFPAFAAGIGRLVRLRMALLRIRGCRLRRPSPPDLAWLRDRLDRECRRFGHHVRLEDDVLVLEWD
jgi:poly-gamma-glutamate synthesis protein (capsule biosynthesis protein)